MHVRERSAVRLPAPAVARARSYRRHWRKRLLALAGGRCFKIAWCSYRPKRVGQNISESGTEARSSEISFKKHKGSCSEIRRSPFVARRSPRVVSANQSHRANEGIRGPWNKAAKVTAGTYELDYPRKQWHAAEPVIYVHFAVRTWAAKKREE